MTDNQSEKLKHNILAAIELGHVKLLLQSIIRAYPDSNDSEQIRLEKALSSLFGSSIGSGRPENFDDLALFHVLNEMHGHENDKLRRALAHINPSLLDGLSNDGQARTGKSARSASEAWASMVDGNSPEAKQQRLRRKAREIGFSPRVMARIEGLADLDDARTNAVIEILNALKFLGVRTLSPYGSEPPDLCSETPSE